MAGSGIGTPVEAISNQTSGSFDFIVDRTNIIDSALRALGVLHAGDTVENDSVMEADCVEALNLMLKSWQNFGIQLWTTQTATIDLTANKSSYIWSLSGDIAVPTAIRVIGGYSRNITGIDMPLTILTQNDYNRLSNKSMAGRPTHFYYDYKDSYGLLYPWPIPNADGISLVLTYHQYFDDMDSRTDRLDFPQSWWEAVKWNLALRLAPEFGRQVGPEIVSLAQTTLKDAREAAFEEGSVLFTPSSLIRNR